MRFTTVIGMVGLILIIVAVLMAVPAILGLVNHDASAWAFLLSAATTLGVGIIFRLLGNVHRPTIRDAFGIVAFGWLAASIFGSIPYVVSKAIPEVTDALFETISGFTTTGATILENVPAQPQPVLLWRSMQQWCGGLGIIMMVTILLPFMEGSGLQMLKAEAGLISQKLRPRMRDTGLMLAAIYVGISLAEFGLLSLDPNLSTFDAICTTLSTVSTGGYGTRTNSIEGFNSHYVEMVVLAFMLIGGTGFLLHFRFLRGEWSVYFRSTEVRAQIVMLLVATLVIAGNLYGQGGKGPVDSVRLAAFQSVSISTGTGFSADAFDQWPGFSQFCLFLLMFMGGSVGSTAGGIKVRRIVILGRLMIREVKLVLYPSRVIVVKMERETVDEKVLRKVISFVLLYLLIFVIGAAFLAATPDANGEQIDFKVAITASAASIGNVGPGLGAAYSNYMWASKPQKIFLAMQMIVGRLEIFSILVLFSPTLWRRPVTRL